MFLKHNPHWILSNHFRTHPLVLTSQITWTLHFWNMDNYQKISFNMFFFNPQCVSHVNPSSPMQIDGHNFFPLANIQYSMVIDNTITKPFNTLSISSTPTILLDGDVLFPFKIFLFCMIMSIYPSTRWFLHTFTTLLIHQIHILPWPIIITCYHQKIEQLKSSLECTIHLHGWPIDLLLILPLVREEECTYTCPPTFKKHDSNSQRPKFDLIAIYHHL
jgi:hypothetical protein